MTELDVDVSPVVAYPLVADGPRYVLGGLEWNVADSSGIRWGANLAGWMDRPDVQGEHNYREGDDGADPGELWYSVKPMTLEGTVVAPTREAAVAAQELVALSTRGARNDLELIVREEVPKRCLVRLAGKVSTPWLSPVAFSVVVPLVALDGFKYDATPISRSTGPRGETRFRRFPYTYPWSYNIVNLNAGGEITVVNRGTHDVAPLLRIVGPVPAGAAVTHVETGRSLRLSQPLRAREFVLLDAGARQVLFNGQSSRRWWLMPGFEWFRLPPGESTLRFTVTGPAPHARLHLDDFRSAWL